MYKRRGVLYSFQKTQKCSEKPPIQSQLIAIETELGVFLRGFGKIGRESETSRVRPSEKRGDRYRLLVCYSFIRSGRL